ncbi:MAG TPA: glycosyltransferase family 4 protein [Gemmatimonadaceae bacterium]
MSDARAVEPGRDRPLVVIVTETFEPEVGGGETQARTLADELIARGYRVRLITRRSRPELSKREVQGELEIVRVPFAGRGRWKKWALMGSAFPALMRGVQGAHVVLVSGFRFLGVPAVVASRTRGVPCVLKADNRGELSGDYFRAGLERFGLRPNSVPVRIFVGIRNAMLRRAQAFIAISEEMVREYGAHGIPVAAIRRIPNAVDARRFCPATPDERDTLRRRLGLPDEPLVLFTGRLVTHKGVRELLRAWERIHSTARGHLVFVGEGGADMHACEEELRAFVRDRKLESRVRFTGAVPNVAEYLRAADVFAFPSLNDALPLSLLEAMACGLPVIATHVGAIGDFLEDDVNGVVVTPGDDQSLERALRRLIAGGPDNARLGAAARATVLERFSHVAVTDAWIRLFSEVQPRGPGQPT